MVDPILDSLKQAEADSGSDISRVSKASDLIPYVRIMDPEGVELCEMQAWPLAIDLLDRFWPNNPRTVIIKPRQMGVSWDFALYCLHHCGWMPYRMLGSVNYTKEAAAELIWRMKVLWSTMPARVRPKVEWATTHANFENGSRAVSLATTDVAGAGSTFSMIGVDEAGLIKNLSENWAAILPAVDKGQLHVFSTPRGMANKFADLVSSARSKDGRFAIREIDYWERPDRDQNTEKGRAWLAARKAELSEREFAREYLREFTRAGNCYFDDETMKRLFAGVKQPMSIQLKGKLKLYAQSIASIDGFVIGADVAEGLDGGDYSTACVMDRRTGKQVAQYHAHVGVTEYAEDLVRLAKMFGNAWLSIEANNHGHAVCMWIYKHLKYRKVYRESREAEGQLASQNKYRLGILTTAASKPAMLAVLENGLRTNTISLCDAGTVEEIATFLCLPEGNYGAAPGKHDDRVISVMLAQDGRGRPFPRTW